MTSEAVMHPDDECRPVAWQPRPPLQLGDAVWVRAVVVRTWPDSGDVSIDVPNAFKAMVQAIVAGESIRRIEGEVKP